jgi:hypothetical protein
MDRCQALLERLTRLSGRDDPVGTDQPPTPSSIDLVNLEAHRLSLLHTQVNARAHARAAMSDCSGYASLNATTTPSGEWHRAACICLVQRAPWF